MSLSEFIQILKWAAFWLIIILPFTLIAEYMILDQIWPYTPQKKRKR